MKECVNLYGVCKIETEIIFSAKIKLYYNDSRKEISIKKDDFVAVSYLSNNKIVNITGRVVKLYDTDPLAIEIDYSSECDKSKIVVKSDLIRDIVNLSDIDSNELYHNEEKDDCCDNHHYTDCTQHHYDNNLGIYPSEDNKNPIKDKIDDDLID